MITTRNIEDDDDDAAENDDDDEDEDETTCVVESGSCPCGCDDADDGLNGRILQKVISLPSQST